MKIDTNKLVNDRQLLENLFEPECRPSLRWLRRRQHGQCARRADMVAGVLRHQRGARKTGQEKLHPRRMKLCKDCKHCLPYPSSFAPDGVDWSLSTCAVSPTLINAVDGTERHRFCETNRCEQMDCGPAARLWEERIQVSAA